LVLIILLIKLRGLKIHGFYIGMLNKLLLLLWLLVLD